MVGLILVLHHRLIHRKDLDGLPVLKLEAFVPPPPPPFTVVVSNVVVPPSPPLAPVPVAPVPPALIVTVLLPGVIG